MGEPSTPGARESNAGDEFHMGCSTGSPASRSKKWTLPSSDGRVSAVDGESLENTEDLFLGVDLMNYGGEDFLTATQVVASQLKYSTRHPHTGMDG